MTTIRNRFTLSAIQCEDNCVAYTYKLEDGVERGTLEQVVDWIINRKNLGNVKLFITDNGIDIHNFDLGNGGGKDFTECDNTYSIELNLAFKKVFDTKCYCNITYSVRLYTILNKLENALAEFDTPDLNYVGKFRAFVRKYITKIEVVAKYHTTTCHYHDLEHLIGTAFIAYLATGDELVADAALLHDFCYDDTLGSDYATITNTINQIETIVKIKDIFSHSLNSPQFYQYILKTEFPSTYRTRGGEPDSEAVRYADSLYSTFFASLDSIDKVRNMLIRRGNESAHDPRWFVCRNIGFMYVSGNELPDEFATLFDASITNAVLVHMDYLNANR